MKYVVSILLTILIITTPYQASAKSSDYVVVVYTLKTLNKTSPDNSQLNSTASGQKLSVKQDIHVKSGTFSISVLPGKMNYSDVRRYKNKLTRMNSRKEPNTWKISLLKDDINESIHQKNMSEMLRQLNADEEENSSENKERNILGWKVRIQEDLLDDHLLRNRALKELQKQLSKIRSRVPYRAMKQLQAVKIFIYKDKGGVDKNVTAYYSPLYKAVVFHDAKILHNLSERQNAVVLHELAHGYHDIVLSYDNVEIKNAFNNAVETGLYQNVKVQDGRTAAKAYALTNHVEYFAELTETYFSRKYGSFENDYFPFNVYELKKYDPVGYKVVEKMWGK